MDNSGSMVSDAEIYIHTEDGGKVLLESSRSSGLVYADVESSKVKLYVYAPGLGEGEIGFAVPEAAAVKAIISFSDTGVPSVSFRPVELLGPCNPDAGNCCEANGTPGCDDAECCALICGADAFCCDSEWDGVCAGAAVAGCEACATPGCDIECQLGDVLEGEDCGLDLNGGCNATPIAFGAVACGETVCGNAWADGGTRDTDWYLIETTEASTTLTATLVSEFSGICFVVGGIDTCTPVVLGDAGDSANCRAGLAAQATVTPGQYVIFVSDAAFEGNPCGGNNDYRVSVEATPCEVFESCGQPNAGPCDSANGTPGCDDEACCSLICGQNPACCDTEWDAVCANAAIEQCGDIGACCVGATCIQATPDDCAANGGDFQGADVDCADVECVPPGPCGPGAGDCFVPNGSPGCEDVDCCLTVCGADAFCCDTEWDQICADSAGVLCVTDPGACCFADGSCEDISNADCIAAGGTFQGVGTTCADGLCTAVCGPGAGDCFIPNGTPGCEDVDCCNLVCGADAFCCDTEWDAICADSAIALCGEPCDLVCDGTDEGEPCGDDTNGGCNGTPVAFGAISCDETICGTAWADGGMRDTDWFVITLTDDCSELTATLTSEFNGVVFVVDGIGACVPVVVGQTGTSNFCEPGLPAFAQVGAGDFAVFVANAGFEGSPCGTNNNYSVTLECSIPCPQIACCFSDGSCEDLDEPGCIAAGGTSQGGGTDCSSVMCQAICGPGAGNCFMPNGTPGCEDAECCDIVCGADAFCCETEWDQICADAAAMLCGDVPKGACCFPDTTCMDGTDADSCTGMGGAFQGPGTACANVVCPDAPDNDSCLGAIELVPGDTVNGSTIDANIDDTFPTCGTTITAPGVWYSVIGTGNTLTASTCNQADYDTKINVYCVSCEEPTCVDGLDDFPGCAGFTTELSWCSQAGSEYLILIQGFNGAVGNFTLSLTEGASCGNAVQCAGSGACCITATGECLDNQTEISCADAGGEYQGDGTACGGAFGGYDIDDCRNDFEDISGTGNEAPNASNIDDAGDVIEIGFDFNFFGNTYGAVGVASNGYLTFGGDLGDFTNDPIPTGDDPNDFIAPYWDDWSPNQNGTVHTQTLGAAPNRRFIAQWTDVEAFGDDTGELATFQAVLFEGSNNIEFRYGDVLWLESPTIGVENADGTDGNEIAGAAPGDCIALSPNFGSSIRCPDGTATKGACCFDDGACAAVEPDECDAAGGNFNGLGTVCAPGLCPGPEGGCCFDDGSCTNLSQADCNAEGGDWQGAFNNCGDVACVPSKGACCLDLVTCTAVTSSECADLGGLYFGDDTVCAPGLCENPPVCGPGNGDCFEANGTPGCDDVECCELVCDLDAFCCETEWDGVCAAAAVKNCEGGACTACGLNGDADEGEECGDDTNGGCNATPIAFGAVDCGGSICGTVWADGGTRDTDWFLITIDTETEIRATLTSEFDGIAFIVDGIDGCAPVVAGETGSSNGCAALADAFACLPAGDYVVFVSHAAFEGSPCGTNNAYQVSVTCTAPCDVPMICGEGAGDCFVPNGSPGCEDEDCCELICGQDAFCCDTEWDQICADAAIAQCDMGEPAEACCFSDDSCLTLTPTDCAAAGGQAQGPGSACVAPEGGSSFGSNPNVAIPDVDAAGVSDTISVGKSLTIDSINIGVQIDHTWVGDLCVTVEHNGTSVELISRMGATSMCDAGGGPFGCPEDNMNITLDDRGSGDIESQCAPNLVGAYIPNEALSAFVGMDVQGDWTITVSDNAAADTGTFVGWSVNINGAGGLVCPDDPAQACCFSDDTCQNLSPDACAAAGGLAQGPGSECVLPEGGTTIESVVNGAIPDVDAAGLSNTISVGKSLTIDDLDINVVVDHTWLGDLCVILEHNGTTVELQSRIGATSACDAGGGPFGCPEDNMNVIYDDNGSGPIEDQCAPGLTGMFIPNEALSVFNGMDLQGDWTLTVSDNAAADTGTFVSWAITANGGGALACPDASPEACCFTDDSCQDLTPGECIAAGGQSQGAGTACVAPEGGTTYDSSPAADIPDVDAGGASDTLTVPDSTIISGMTVGVQVDHTWLGDLCVTIEHNGTSVVLMSRIGATSMCDAGGGPFGCADDNMNIMLDDAGSGPIEDQCAPNLTGMFIPEEALSAFDGMDAQGDWTMTVSDNAAGDTGTFVSWSITVGSGGGGLVCPEPTGDPACSPDAGNCCEVNGSPGCDSPDCCNLVCGLDSFCCESNWDGVCVNLAIQNCGICNNARVDVPKARKNGIGE